MGMNDRVTSKQMGMIRAKQKALGLPVSTLKALSPMTKANASAWIASLLAGVDPKKVNPKKDLGVTSGNTFQRARAVTEALSGRS